MTIFRVYLFIVLFLITAEAQTKVYWNVHVGEYQRRLDLREFKGQSFLSLMKERVYPALLEESQNSNTLSPISSIRRGEGLEIVLTDSISTYHVNYKAHWEDKAERSGRSFSAVDHEPSKKPVEYVWRTPLTNTIYLLLRNCFLNQIRFNLFTMPFSEFFWIVTLLEWIHLDLKPSEWLLILLLFILRNSIAI